MSQTPKPENVQAISIKAVLTLYMGGCMHGQLKDWPQLAFFLKESKCPDLDPEADTGKYKMFIEGYIAGGKQLFRELVTRLTSN